MRRKILDLLHDSPLITRFLSTPSPWWLVLMADLIFVALSCLATFTFNPEPQDRFLGWWGSALAQSIVVFTVYAVLMMVTRTFRYIVRLSVVEDMYRVVALTVSASAVLAVTSMVTAFAFGAPYFNLWNIFVIGLLSFSLMMFSRLGIKYIYRQFTANGIQRRRVIVLGSTVDSFAFASALLNEPAGIYKPVALLSLSSDSLPATINGLPLFPYSPDTIKEIFDTYKCDTLMFPSAQLKFMRSGVADVFLKHHIRLLVFNQIKEFDDKGGKSVSSSVRDIHIEDLLCRDVIQADTTEVEQVLRGQVVMITGAAGSIGSEIVNQVAALRASEVVLVDQAETPMHELQLAMEANHPEIKMHLFVGDVANPARMEQAFMRYRPRYVFHAAAYKHVPMMERNPSEAILTNVFGTKNLADLAVKYKVEKFVMISTDKAVNPTNVMGASKRIAEIYVQSYFYHLRHISDNGSTRFITTRFGNVLGSNGSVIPLFRRQIEQGGPVTLTHRDIIRYFMTIPEACSLVLQAGTMGQGGEIFIFDMGQPVKIYDLATRMISLSGLRPGEDIEIIETGLRPGEKLYEELLNDKELTMTTRNNKIMIAKVRVYDYDEVQRHLETLRELTTEGEYHDIVAEMKRMVPEYKSQNSVWASIDKEISKTEVINEIPR
ncbi:MAG: nucleoside-diphosphate sugar epimerase/dehydratase [Bacteroidales bacterium]|nr:nucleoside-diphosphate sugar epimerase/dehydratase [Bacteroidales bacterium]